MAEETNLERKGGGGGAMALLEKYALLNSHIEQTRQNQQRLSRKIEELQERIEQNRATREQYEVCVLVPPLLL